MNQVVFLIVAKESAKTTRDLLGNTQKGRKNVNGRVIVNNVDHVEEQYMVARLDGGVLWFWGAYDDEVTAKQVAESFDNGLVVENAEV